MYINTPKDFSRKDVVFCGNIYKNGGFGYWLQDLYNKKTKMSLSGYGWYNYVYKVCDTYLFIIGNQIRNKEINIKKIDFLSKVLKFEYLLKTKGKTNLFTELYIPSKVLILKSKEKPLEAILTRDNMNRINHIIETKKIHLQGIQKPLNRLLMFLCDNEQNMGIYENVMVVNLLYSNKITVLKDTSIDGYIIKLDNTPFDC